VFANLAEANWLATARFFLFCSRDVCFVVGMPVFLFGTRRVEGVTKQADVGLEVAGH